MKKYILFCVIVVISTIAKAQSGYNYQEWGVGAGVSYERGYTNITTQYSHPGFNLNLVYNYSPYVPIEAEIQVGSLSGGGLSPKQDPYGREYSNSYKAVVFHGDLQLGEVIDYSNDWFLDIAKNIYGGIGLGFISNSNTVQRNSIYQPSYVFPGSNTSLDIMVPLRVGYEFKIFNDYNEPAFAIDLTYIHSFAFGEGLDGYDDPPSKFKNNAIDQYRQFNVSVKFYFGKVVSYTKLIREFY